MYDRLTNFHGINNIVWVWNSIAADWYPGDDIVDILSADVYATGNGVSPLLDIAVKTRLMLTL